MASNQDDEEDWEKADITLPVVNEEASAPSSLHAASSVNQSVKKGSSSIAPPFVGSVESSSSSARAGLGSRFPHPIPVSAVDDVIDDALYHAVCDPKERLNLLNIEYQILEFIRAPDQTHKSFPPGYNSYRRLLMYRVGQRFRLSHTTVDASHEHDKEIVFTKTQDTIVPKRLLMSLPYEDGGGELSRNASYESIPGASSAKLPGSGSGSAPGPTPEAPRKIVMMKRNTSRDDIPTSKKDSSTKGPAGGDKEKLYLEAKARIFGSGSVSGSEAPPPEEDERRKAVERNRVADERDPDFNRSVSKAPLAVPSPGPRPYYAPPYPPDYGAQGYHVPPPAQVYWQQPGFVGMALYPPPGPPPGQYYMGPGSGGQGPPPGRYPGDNSASFLPTDFPPLR